MIGSIITLVIVCLILEIYHSIIITFQYFEIRNTNKIMAMDSSQVYLSAVKTQKTKKPIIPSRRNGIPMQEATDEPTNDIDNGINLLNMDPDEGYRAVMDTMGVSEDIRR